MGLDIDGYKYIINIVREVLYELTDLDSLKVSEIIDEIKSGIGV